MVQRRQSKKNMRRKNDTTQSAPTEGGSMRGVEDESSNGKRSLGIDIIREQMMKSISKVLPQAIESHKVATEARLAGIEEGMIEKMVKNVDMKENEKVQVEMGTIFEGLGKLLNAQALENERICKELEEIREEADRDRRKHAK